MHHFEKLRRVRCRPYGLALVLLALVVAEPAAQAEILTQFQGGSLSGESSLGGGFIPPDMGGSVGDGYVVQMINGEMGVYTTSGATVGSPTSLTSFWSGDSTALGGTSPSDPRVIFDPSSGRWFASAISTQATSNNILVGVSNSSNPTGSFSQFSITAPGNFADYPTLGVNGAAVTIGTNNFSSSTGSSVGVSVYSIPKSSLTAASPTLSGLSSFTNTNQAGFTPQAVTNASGSGTNTTVLSTNYGASGLLVSNVSGANAGGATLTYLGSFNSVSGTLPNAPTQPGGTTYSPGDNRISSGTYQVGNLVYYANNVWNGVQDVIQWGVIDVNTYTLVQSGTLSLPGQDLTYPSISANANGTFVIGFNGSGATSNISAYSAVCYEGTGICDTPALMYAGTADNYNVTGSGSVNRWGDYSWTTVDPANPNDFWLFQEYPISNTNWGTVITEIGVPEPSALALLTAGLLGLGLIRRRSGTLRSMGESSPSRL